MLCFHAAQIGNHLSRTQKDSEQKQKHFLCPSLCVRAGKRGNICVGNNVSATMCRQQCVLVCQGLNNIQQSLVIRRKKEMTLSCPLYACRPKILKERQLASEVE